MPNQPFDDWRRWTQTPPSPDQQQAAELIRRVRDGEHDVMREIAAALAAARMAGYRKAVEDSRRVCARAGGCIS